MRKNSEMQTKLVLAEQDAEVQMMAQSGRKKRSTPPISSDDDGQKKKKKDKPVVPNMEEAMSAYLLASADEKRVKSDIRKEELELKKREAAIREKELGI